MTVEVEVSFLLAFAAVLAGVLVVLPAQAQTQRKDMVLKGDAACTRCHDETEEYPVLAIGKTKHGTIADGRTPTCTSCHGESDTHANKPADAVERPKPERMFGKRSSTPVALRNDTCLNCHQSDEREAEVPIFRVDEEVERVAVERIREHRRQRDERSWAQAMKRFDEAVRAFATREVDALGDDVLMLAAIDAARADATTGEMMGAMKRHLGWAAPHEY